ncbi:hypothetical protein ACN47E_002295 [Coniothyrium glycines]
MTPSLATGTHTTDIDPVELLVTTPSTAQKPALAETTTYPSNPSVRPSHLPLYQRSNIVNSQLASVTSPSCYIDSSAALPLSPSLVLHPQLKRESQTSTTQSNTPCQRLALGLSVPPLHAKNPA